VSQIDMAASRRSYTIERLKPVFIPTDNNPVNIIVHHDSTPLKRRVNENVHLQWHSLRE